MVRSGKVMSRQVWSGQAMSDHDNVRSIQVGTGQVMLGQV